MEIPNLVRERLGGESIEATVSLGDEDVIAVTPTRTILYRGDGLLSDESVSVYSHDVERLDLSKGRRNTKFSLTYVDGTKEFKVPGDRADTLLQILLQGVLRVAGVAEEDESVAGVFQFSELTLVVTEKRLVKHIGAPVWDEDFEVFDFADVTDLDFEEGSVATQIVLTVDGRPQRIKAPSDQAPQVEQTLTQTLCSYYDVNSLEALAAKLGTDEDTGEDTPDADSSSKELELDDGISPLVGRSSDEEATNPSADDPTTSPESSSLERSADAGGVDGGGGGSTASETPASESQTERSAPDRTSSQSAPDEGTGGVDTVSTTEENTRGSGSRSTKSVEDVAADRVDPEEIDAIKEQLSTLTEAVKRQNKLLRQHNEKLDGNDEKIDQLIEELRQGR
jgi:hypothetical protein